MFGSPATVLDLEGVYLKGQGVVYTITLPPLPAGPQSPTGGKATPKVSEWEQVRQQLQGEKPRPVEKPERKELTLEEVVLKVFADNGSNFSQMQPTDRLTLVVTFRKPAPASVSVTSSASGSGQSSSTSTPATGFGTPGTPVGGGRGGSGGSTRTAPSTLQDYLLLGELHFKQNRFEEARAAFARAVEQAEKQELSFDPETRYSDVRQQIEQSGRSLKQAYVKLAQALLAQGRIEEAQQVLSKSVEASAKVKVEKSKPVPPVLPAKLVISATQQALQAVASGKMSFEEFKKAAQVERISFPTTEKKATESK
jgi:tetratricopeptide (TPR) repeat protein